MTEQQYKDLIHAISLAASIAAVSPYTRDSASRKAITKALLMMEKLAEKYGALEGGGK